MPAPWLPQSTACSTTPIFAPGVEPLFAIGAVTQTWAADQPFAPRLADLLRQILSSTAASTAAPALSSMLIYLLMAMVLVVRPEGLFPANRR